MQALPPGHQVQALFLVLFKDFEQEKMLQIFIFFSAINSVDLLCKNPFRRAAAARALPICAKQTFATSIRFVNTQRLAKLCHTRSFLINW